MEHNGWIYEARTSPPGWYATMWCWDASEGTFVGARYWDGERWFEQTRDYPRTVLRVDCDTGKADLVEEPPPSTEPCLELAELPYIAHSCQSFPDEESAEAWADEHDPEGESEAPHDAVSVKLPDSKPSTVPPLSSGFTLTHVAIIKQGKLVWKGALNASKALSNGDTIIVKISDGT